MGCKDNAYFFPRQTFWLFLSFAPLRTQWYGEHVKKHYLCVDFCLFAMRYRKFISFLFILFRPLFLCAEDDVYFSKIGMEKGLSQLSVTAIYQDEIGCIWFGTRQGVNIFDGNSIRVLQPIPNDTTSLSGALIKGICGNGKGSIYILTQNGIDVYNLRTNTLSRVFPYTVDAITYGADKLWIARQTSVYTHQEGTTSLHSNITQSNSPIKVISRASSGEVFVGTVSSGVFRIGKNKKITHVITNTSQIASIFEDRHGNIWVGSWENGLYKIEKGGALRSYTADKLKERGLSSNFVRAITEDNEGALWIGTKEGLDKFFADKETFRHYGSAPADKQLSNESVWALMKDNQGTIWIGSYFGGVNYFNPAINFYTYHNLQQGALRNKPFPIISNIIEDKKRNLLLCTEGEGLIYYNTKDNTYTTFRYQHNNNQSLTSDNIKTAYYDADANVLWLGLHLGGLCRMDINTFQVTRFPEIRASWKQSNIVRTILPYKDKLLIATYNGLFLFDKQTHKFSLFSDTLHKTVQYFVDVKIDNDQNIWIASRGLYRYNIKTGKIHQYHQEANNRASLSNNDVVKILIDRKASVWVATNGGGLNLYDRKTDSFIRFDTQNSNLKNNYISNLMESATGSLIVATTQNLSVINPDTHTIYNYGPKNGLPLNSLYNGGMCITSSGEIYIAGMNGMISFFEKQLDIPQQPFNLKLMNLRVNNQLILPNDKSGILKQSLPYTTNIKLNHKDAMVTIEFTSDNYIEANQPLFRYRLEGFSEQWISLPQGVNKLNFMNLHPGKYTLMLEAVSAMTGNVLAATALNIRMCPPIYNTWYAYLFYLLIIVLGIHRYLAFTRSKLLLKTSLEYEKKEKAHIEAVNQSKLRFFTNISHEFRTPLTLIKGQLDMLLDMPGVPPDIHRKTLNIRRNTRDMQRLINELLEFRKSEQGFLTIKVQKISITRLLHEIYLSFRDYANYRHIQFDFRHPDEEIMLWVDPLQVQKACYNLISNAFKYTREDGTISIRLTETNDDVCVKIIDTGIGIEAEAIKKVFDRFYQVETGSKPDNISPGTGIGLALTKSIVEKHTGKIEVTSQPQKGSVFSVTLKKGNAHYEKQQIATHQEDPDIKTLNNIDLLEKEFVREIVDSQSAGKEKKHTILIVEDNDELRTMLSNVFSIIYTIHTAIDGEEGLEKTRTLQPDIVLSDVMMPKMSGSEMCRKIKNDFSVCHIPVVLLTAQTAEEYTLEGLRLGADDYITKPFNLKTLVVRCNNLVNGRKVLQEKFSKSIEFKPDVLATNDFDRDFLHKAHQVIENHLDDMDFNIAVLSDELAFSRTKLFNKIKGITGKTPNEFILNIKMKKATELLSRHSEYNITEITYRLGFSSPKYFSKCFKEQFGVSPSAFRKQFDR